jgi:hypothetical protein
MTTLASKHTDGTRPIPNGSLVGHALQAYFEFDITAAQITAGDIIDMCVLPANHVVTDMVLIPDDLDSGTAITLDVGIMSGTPGDVTSVRTCGAEFFSGSTAAQGATVTRMSLKTGFRVAPTAAERSIGVKIVVDATTAVAGKIGLLVTFSPSVWQVIA